MKGSSKYFYLQVGSCRLADTHDRFPATIQHQKLESEFQKGKNAMTAAGPDQPVSDCHSQIVPQTANGQRCHWVHRFAAGHRWTAFCPELGKMMYANCKDY